MLCSYWSISFNVHNIFVRSSKKFIFRKPVVLERKETNQGQLELVDRNVLLSEMLRERHTCDTAIGAMEACAPSGEMC